MFLTRMSVARLLILALLLTPAQAYADYASTTATLGGTGNTVEVEAYNGSGLNYSTLNAGEVRLTFQHLPGANAGLFHGFQSVAFNTDLTLTAGQINGPASWTASPNSSYGNVGPFSWVVGSAQPLLQDNVTLLISGLGSNATLSHFMTGTAQFAGNVVNVTSDPNGINITSQTVSGNAEPQATPEPTSLALAGLGIGGLALRRYGRRKTPLAG